MPDSKLPEHPSLGYLKKSAKTRLAELRRSDPEAKLSTALLMIAREYGFSSWRALKAHTDAHDARQIENPVARLLPIADAGRSAAFYRDVLGFEIQQRGDAMEAALGPARIQFVVGTARPAGSTIVFLQTANVVATHAALRARGCAPSDIENVNWIKMRMFEVRDPDGNVLWFGQTYHREQDSPSRRGGQPHGLRQALPELPFDDVPAAVAYYRDVLGFRINYQQDDVGVMDRDAITVLLIARTEQHRGIGSFAAYVSDVDALYEELAAKHAGVLGPPVSHPWGLRDFRVIDPEGNRITFAQTFE